MKKNSFVIVIKDCQHGSWQGTIEWVEGKKTENFRSALELLKLMDSATNEPSSSFIEKVDEYEDHTADE